MSGAYGHDIERCLGSASSMYGLQWGPGEALCGRPCLGRPTCLLCAGDEER